MKLFIRKIGLVFFAVLIQGYLYGQVAFSTSATPSHAGKEELINFRIIIENSADIQQIIPPDFRQFTMIGNPSPVGGINEINGHITKYISFSFILKPKKTGKFTIGPAKAKISGKWFTSKPVLITVTSKSPFSAPPYSLYDPAVQEQPPAFKDYIFRKGENVMDKVRDNMQLKLEVDKTTCFVGEPIVASYKLFTRLKSDSRLSRSPSFNGFSVVDMKQGNDEGYTTGRLNGKEYNVYLIRQSQLYPLQSGVIDLEPAELENNIQFIKEDYAAKQRNAVIDLFDEFSAGLPHDAIITETVNITNKPVSITVKPLPEEGKPEHFSGAVGKFTIAASLKKKQITSDESGLLSVTISGSGNMQMITAPEIRWPEGTESYEPSMKDSLNTRLVPVNGSKHFDFSFSVNKIGDYQIESVRFSFFDPVTKAYQTVSTGVLTFSVIKGNTRQFQFSGNEKKKPAISFINNMFNHRWQIILFMTILLVTGLTIWLLKSRRKVPVAVMIKEQVPDELSKLADNSLQNQQNPLFQTESCLTRDDCFEFYTILNTELKNYLSRKFLLGQNEVNSQILTVAMDKKGISNQTVLQLQELLAAIEWQLYTPYERTEKMNELYQKAQEIVQTINLRF